MKSLKLVLVAFFASIQLPLFGMDFLDPVLQETIKNEDKYELYFNSNREFNISKKIPKKLTVVPDNCAVCKEALQLKRDWIKIKPCNDIVHRNCIVDWVTSDWTQALENKSNQCPVCNQIFDIKSIKSFENIINPKNMPIVLEYQLEPREILAKKSTITMFCVFALLASQSKLPWYVHKVTPFPIGWLENSYGLSSSPFTTSSKFQIKYSGKLLYMIVSDIIPSYLINKKLKQHLWNYIVDAYSMRDVPNNLPSI